MQTELNILNLRQKINSTFVNDFCTMKILMVQAILIAFGKRYFLYVCVELAENKCYFVQVIISA